MHEEHTIQDVGALSLFSRTTRSIRQYTSYQCSVRVWRRLIDRRWNSMVALMSVSG